MKGAHRLFLFVAGLAIGAAASALIIHYGKEDKPVQQINSSTVSLPASKVVPEPQPDKEPLASEITIKERRELPDIPDSPPEIKKIKEEPVVDVIQPEDEIIVRKDELIASIKVIIEIAKHETDSLADPADSVISQVSGIRPTLPSQELTIEFWRSPINYKGFKMNRSKLILFGVPETADTRIEKRETGLYLLTAGRTFRLDYSPDFKPLQAVPASTEAQLPPAP